MLAAAAAVLVATAIGHSVLGELLIFRRLDPAALPPLLRSSSLGARTLRGTWHLPSVLGVALAAIVWHERDAPDVFVVRAIAIGLASCAVVFAGLTRGRHPGWIAFVVAAGFAWLGAD